MGRCTVCCALWMRSASNRRLRIWQPQSCRPARQLHPKFLPSLKTFWPARHYRLKGTLIQQGRGSADICVWEGPKGCAFNAYRCRIYDDGAGWVLEKTSGAERLRGRFYTLSDTHLAFVGARNGPQQAQGWYGMHTTRDTVGVLERASVGTGQDRLRILFPPDQTGGTFDVMDLRR